ncbi:hypothetical protein EAG_08327 [Camponotus floridanus]|uniref:Uncharacterized protein n=1 Tax=Camponotus floridanus TaxID=104421 RepID=E2A4C2_CAMFO|nr:hypothetical protein EAG_08327 [Camponotus floridanus]
MLNTAVLYNYPSGATTITVQPHNSNLSIKGLRLPTMVWTIHSPQSGSHVSSPGCYLSFNMEYNTQPRRTNNISVIPFT